MFSLGSRGSGWVVGGKVKVKASDVLGSGERATLLSVALAATPMSNAEDV